MIKKDLSEINTLYNSFGLESEEVWHKTKLLLSIYRKVVWSINTRSSDMVCEYEVTYGMSIENALSFLNNFAPIEKRVDFEEKINHLFETKWLIELIDKSLRHIKEYPEKGSIYYDIIYNSYLRKEKMTDLDCMYKLAIEKTTFYKRKKEAIYLMGIALWGYAIPEFKSEMKSLEYIHKNSKSFLTLN
ncbi:hypothetical protein [Helcococcus ovis]|uniref:hypothetical protein n=2 Tax=Helcococcus ovis TaxID=72026 RepID=UPI00106F2515|nr:hypothetical protein [Helcococcus ovis]TFF65029.1 hypothetical protein EQF92_03785 [Helcococcus ovis]